jgi:hypothetical protein
MDTMKKEKIDLMKIIILGIIQLEVKPLIDEVLE